MKKHVRRTAFALAVLMVLLAMPTSVFAADFKLYSVQAINLETRERGTLVLLEYQGKAYIDPADAAVLASVDGWEMNDENGNLTFKLGAQRVVYKGTYVRDDRNYYPLKELMDTLRCKYAYDETTQTMLFMPCMVFPKDVQTECTRLYSQGFEAQMIKENTGYIFTPALVFASVYNVVGGLRVDQLWGGYTRELYEKAVAGIMAGPENEDITTEFISDADAILQGIGTLQEFDEVLLGDAAELCYVLNEDIDAFAEIYNSFGEVNLVREGTESGIGVFGAGDVMEILSRVYASRHAAETYVNAVKYGLVENTGEMNDHLRGASQELYNYYDENKPTNESVLEDAATTVIENVVGDASKVIVTDLLLGMKNPVVEVTKLIFDVYGMSEKTNAVEMVPVCIAIQDAAMDSYSKALKKKDKDGNLTAESALKMKYSTILYLRTYQYAWEQYEFDGFLGPTARTQMQKATDAIKKLTAFDDEQLMMTVDNAEIELAKVNGKPVDTGDGPRQMDVNRLMEDGIYEVSLKKDSVVEQNAHWEFKAQIHELIAYTDEQIEALRVGDRITDVYTVEKISREEWQSGSVVVIGSSGFFPYFRKDYESGLWYLTLENDRIARKLSDERTFYVTKGKTQIYDNFSWAMGEEMMQRVEDLTDCTGDDFYAYSEWIDPVEIVVENGEMTKIVFNYAP